MPADLDGPDASSSGHAEKRPEITQLLAAAEADEPGAQQRLWQVVYDEIHALARHQLAGERRALSHDATTLVNEAYIRLLGPEGPRHWNSRGHFFCAAAEALRRICVDDARKSRRIKRGGGLAHLPLSGELPAENGDFDMVALDDALSRLAEHDQRKARVVSLRYFAGLDREAVAEAIGVSVRTVDNDWDYARAWLFRALHGDSDKPA